MHSASYLYAHSHAHATPWDQRASANAMRAVCPIAIGILVLAFCALWAKPVVAQEWTLLSSPGVCTYTYDRLRDTTTTRCQARALLIDTQTSDAIHCFAEVEGNQFLAPSVQENAPETITCWRTGRIVRAPGPFGVVSLDDDFHEENTRIRRRGVFIWSNAFWIYGLEGDFNLRLCASAQDIQNPDFAQRCSQEIFWADEGQDTRLTPGTTD